MIIEKSVKDYVSVLASGEPTPGGGSVAALAGSLGSALTTMVGNLTFGKKAYKELDDDLKKEMDDSFKELYKSIEKLNSITHEDTQAFGQAMKALQMPKGTEEEKRIRSEALEEGYKVALEVPLRCAEECFNVLQLQNIFAHHGNLGAITDVGIGAMLAAVGLEGAILNVIINLKGIKDTDYKNNVEEKIDTLMSEGIKLKDESLKIVYERLK